MPEAVATTGKGGKADAGFASASGAFAPRAHQTVKKTMRENEREGKVEHKTIATLSATIRVALRGEKGPMAGKPFLGVVNGEQFPDEVDSHDRETWLQPGTYMDVPLEAAYHMFGNVWDPTLPDKRDIINRYGGPQYAPPPGDKVSGRGAPMVIAGLPKIPDILLAEVDRRGNVKGEWKSVFELYTKGLLLGRPDVEAGGVEED